MVMEDMVVMMEAMMEAVTEEATARVSPPLPAMVVVGEEAATPRARPVLLPMDGEDEPLRLSRRVQQEFPSTRKSSQRFGCVTYLWYFREPKIVSFAPT